MAEELLVPFVPPKDVVLVFSAGDGRNPSTEARRVINGRPSATRGAVLTHRGQLGKSPKKLGRCHRPKQGICKLCLYPSASRAMLLAKILPKMLPPSCPSCSSR